jgi:hypothetical protein
MTEARVVRFLSPFCKYFPFPINGVFILKYLELSNDNNFK